MWSLVHLHFSSRKKKFSNHLSQAKKGRDTSLRQNITTVKRFEGGKSWKKKQRIFRAFSKRCASDMADIGWVDKVRIPYNPAGGWKSGTGGDNRDDYSYKVHHVGIMTNIMNIMGESENFPPSQKKQCQHLKFEDILGKKIYLFQDDHNCNWLQMACNPQTICSIKIPQFDSGRLTGCP